MSAQENAQAQEPRRGPMGHGPGGRMMPGEKPKNLKGTLAKLIAFMGRFKAAIVVVLVFAVGSTIFNIVGPKVLSTATTELFNGIVAKIDGSGGIDFDAIARILVFTLGLYLLSAACSFVQGWIMSSVSQRTCYQLRGAIADKIDRMPMGYFERTSVGDTLSRITNDVDTLGQSLNQGVTQLITSVTTIIGVLIMMLSINPLMTLITVVILPVSVVLIMVVVKRSQKYFVAQQRTLGKINGIVEETFSGHAIVKAFNREDGTVDRFNETNAKLYGSAWKSQFFSGLMQPIMTFVGNLGYVAVAIAGSFLAVQGVITVGDIQAFIQYVKNFTQPITQLTQVSNVLQQMAAAAERIFEFLDAPEEEPDHATARTADVECNVQFDHVRFGYDPEKPVIKDFSAQVSEGQTVALVGPTGAGKTTMVKLLMRFYDVQSGCIKIGGTDIRDFARDDLRSLFGMVLQDTWLFHGTIRDNIRYGGGGGGEGGLRQPLHPDAAAGLRHRDQRGRQQHQPGPAPAADHRARHPGRPPHAHPRRGHQLGGHAHRGAYPEGHGQPHGRAHLVRHRASPVHHQERGSHPRHPRRRHRGAGHARGTAGAWRFLRGVV